MQETILLICLEKNIKKMTPVNICYIYKACFVLVKWSNHEKTSSNFAFLANMNLILVLTSVCFSSKLCSSLAGLFQSTDMILSA